MYWGGSHLNYIVIFFNFYLKKKINTFYVANRSIICYRYILYGFADLIESLNPTLVSIITILEFIGIPEKKQNRFWRNIIPSEFSLARCDVYPSLLYSNTVLNTFRTKYSYIFLLFNFYALRCSRVRFDNNYLLPTTCILILFDPAYQFEFRATTKTKYVSFLVRCKRNPPGLCLARHTRFYYNTATQMGKKKTSPYNTSWTKNIIYYIFRIIIVLIIIRYTYKAKLIFVRILRKTFERVHY